MKGARSGVQKLMKCAQPFLYDIGCICHLADLTIKAGMKTLPVDYLWTFFITFITVATENSHFQTIGVPCFLLNYQPF